MSEKKKRHAGYSLIELIVVIGILGLATALLVPAIGNAFQTENKKCAANVNSLIQRSRVSAMSWGTSTASDLAVRNAANRVFIVIRAEDDGVYGYQHRGTPTSYNDANTLMGREKLADQRAARAIATNDPNPGSDPLRVGGQGLYISFNRATGRLERWGDTPGSPAGSWVGGDFVITVGSYTVQVYPLTGATEEGRR